MYANGQDTPSYLQDEDGLARSLTTGATVCCACARSTLGTCTLPRDVVQETLLRAWRNADRFRGTGSEITWITRIAITCAKATCAPRGNAAARPRGAGQAARPCR